MHYVVRFYSLFVLVLKHLEGQQPPPNTARLANIFLLGVVRRNPAESLVWESIAVAYPGKSELSSDQLRSYLQHSRSQMSC